MSALPQILGIIGALGTGLVLLIACVEGVAGCFRACLEGSVSAPGLRSGGGGSGEAPSGRLCGSLHGGEGNN